MTDDNPWSPPGGDPVPWPTAPSPAGPQTWGQPYGQPGWTPYPAAPQGGYQDWDRHDTTNAVAVLALVTGVLALFPVAIPAGVAGIRQSRRRRERGEGLAIAGLVLGCVWAAVIVLGVLASAVGSGGGSSADSPVLGRVGTVASTTVGSCLDLNDGGTAPVGCDGPHDEEVFDVTTPLGTGSWPGAKALRDGAEGECSWSFDTYTGEPDGSFLAYGYYLPDRPEWERGEHRVVCVVLNADGSPLVGSMKAGG